MLTHIPISIRDASAYSPLTLAFLGDAVYEQLVREHLVLSGNRPVGEIHKLAVQKVRASFQAACWEQLVAILTPEEITILKRGRNSSGHPVPKSATHQEYHRATGVECLFGFLHLTGQTERITEIFAIFCGDIEKTEKKQAQKF